MQPPLTYMLPNRHVQSHTSPPKEGARKENGKSEQNRLGKTTSLTRKKTEKTTYQNRLSKVPSCIHKTFSGH